MKFLYLNKFIFFSRRSWWTCTCCLSNQEYTIGFLRFCKQVKKRKTKKIQF